MSASELDHLLDKLKIIKKRYEKINDLNSFDLWFDYAIDEKMNFFEERVLLHYRFLKNQELNFPNPTKHPSH